MQGNRYRRRLKKVKKKKKAEESTSSVCTQMHAAWETSRGNESSMCGHNTTTFLEPLRCVGMAHTTGELQWTDTHFRKDKQERQGGGEGAVKEQLRCVELFYGMGDWLGESLWVSISGEGRKGQQPPRARIQSILIFRETSRCIKRLAWMNSGAKRQSTGGGSKDRL